MDLDLDPPSDRDSVAPDPEQAPVADMALRNPLEPPAAWLLEQALHEHEIHWIHPSRLVSYRRGRDFTNGMDLIDMAWRFHAAPMLFDLHSCKSVNIRWIDGWVLDLAYASFQAVPGRPWDRYLNCFLITLIHRCAGIRLRQAVVFLQRTFRRTKGEQRWRAITIPLVTAIARMQRFRIYHDPATLERWWWVDDGAHDGYGSYGFFAVEAGGAPPFRVECFTDPTSGELWWFARDSLSRGRPGRWFWDREGRRVRTALAGGQPPAFIMR